MAIGLPRSSGNPTLPMGGALVYRGGTPPRRLLHHRAGEEALAKREDDRADRAPVENVHPKIGYKGPDSSRRRQ